jgi:hypothetical protein
MVGGVSGVSLEPGRRARLGTLWAAVAAPERRRCVERLAGRGAAGVAIGRLLE